MVKRLKSSEKGGNPKYTGSSEIMMSRSVQGLALLLPINEYDNANEIINAITCTGIKSIQSGIVVEV